MGNREGGYFDSSEGNTPSRESLANDSYKYIYFGVDRTVVISSLSVDIEHGDLINRPFNGETDDAGRFVLKWAMSLDQITQQVDTFQKFANLKKIGFNPVEYRKQLESNFLLTNIKIEPDYGSDTLKYKPNPATRSQFMGRLGQLYPNANIFQGK